MNDGPALLRAILERPDEDMPRLVYADWLDANGQEYRGTFIRLQCGRPDVSESVPMSLSNGLVATLKINRGFVSEITLPWALVVEDVLRDLFTRHPIESVVVSDAMMHVSVLHTAYAIITGRLPAQYWGRIFNCKNSEALQVTLNAVVRDWGRHIAGLPQLVGAAT